MVELQQHQVLRHCVARVIQDDLARREDAACAGLVDPAAAAEEAQVEDLEDPVV